MDCKDCERIREEIRNEIAQLIEEIATLKAKYASLSGFIRGISFILGGVGVFVVLVKDILFEKH